MNEVVHSPQTGHGLATRANDRSVERFAGRVDANARKQLAIMGAEADLQVARVQAVGYVGQQAMQSVAMVSQLEGQLSELVPLATSRLQAIADMTALATAEVVASTVKKVSS